MVREHHHKDRNTVSAAWRKAELNIAKKDPQGWASLAKASLRSLIEFYTPNGIPQMIVDAHMEKYKDVYQKYPSLGQSPPIKLWYATY